ncbi:hypothetical protein [Thauera sinica]|uniref:Uncharacterized protein n=1 Tax=Thauera sinica TaxID=2665146 RepID=A0ABW1AQU6_9RHOO|nr:hypothetical protein [Thauera sp. K11]ATE60069.1 hypothetical protein CCZ27_09005 [Thauera sp. K11]
MYKQHSAVFQSANALILKGVIPTPDAVGALHPELTAEEIEQALAAWFRYVGTLGTGATLVAQDAVTVPNGEATAPISSPPRSRMTSGTSACLVRPRASW